MAVPKRDPSRQRPRLPQERRRVGEDQVGPVQPEPVRHESQDQEGAQGDHLDDRT